MSYYIKGGSRYNEPDPNVWVINHLSGYVSGHYTDENWKDLNDSGAVGDPYWRLGGEGGQNWAEFGLSGSYGIKIDVNGVSGFNPSIGEWTGLMGVGTVPDHNDLNGLNDDDNYEHITQTQKDALHAAYTNANALAAVGMSSIRTFNGIIDSNQSTMRFVVGSYMDIKPSTDDYGILIRDSGSDSYWCNIKNVNGVTYIGDNETATANMLAISSTTITIPSAGILNLPGGGYMNATEHFAETHIRIRNGNYLFVYSAGNDKYLSLRHNDTNVDFVVNDGNLYMYIANDIYLEPDYTSNSGNWRMSASSTFLYMANSASNTTTELNQIGRIGGTLRPVNSIYAATFLDDGGGMGSYSHVDDLQLLRDVKIYSVKQKPMSPLFPDNKQDVFDMNTLPWIKAHSDVDAIDKDSITPNYEDDTPKILDSNSKRYAIGMNGIMGFNLSALIKIVERQDGIVDNNTTRDLIIEDIITRIEELENA